MIPIPPPLDIPVPPPFIDDSIPLPPPLLDEISPASLEPPLDDFKAVIAGLAVVQKAPDQLTDQDKFLQREIKNVEKELAARASVKKYFVECTEADARQLLKQQQAFWQVAVNLRDDSSAQKVNEVVIFALAQIKILDSFLESGQVMKDPVKVVNSIHRYTREELYQLLLYFREIFPEASTHPLFDIAARTPISDLVRKSYKGNKTDWKSAFIQHYQLSHAIIKELLWRNEGSGREVIIEPRPYSEELAKAIVREPGQKSDHDLAIEAAMVKRRRILDGQIAAVKGEIAVTNEQLKKVAKAEQPGKGLAPPAAVADPIADQLKAKKLQLTQRFHTLKLKQIEEVQRAREDGIGLPADLEPLSDDSSPSGSGDLSSPKIKISIVKDNGK